MAWWTRQSARSPDQVSCLTPRAKLTYVLVGMFPRNPKGGKRKLRKARPTSGALATRGSPRGLQTGFSECQPGCNWGQQGSLYHHFGSKEAWGYAMVERSLPPGLRGHWVRHLENGRDRMDASIGIVQGLSVRPAVVRRGCCANSLAQELFPIDAGFREKTVMKAGIMSIVGWLGSVRAPNKRTG